MLLVISLSKYILIPIPPPPPHTSPQPGCTFNPAINKNSQRAAQMAKKDNRTVQERLYDERVLIANKAKQRQAEKMIEDDTNFKEDYTFGPEMETKNTVIRAKKSATPVVSRYRSVGASPCQRTQRSTDNSCTFTPKVKGVRSDMGSAKLYLKSNVFSRLQTPSSAKGNEENREPGLEEGKGEGEGERSVMDMDTFMSNVQGGAGNAVSATKRRPLSAGRTRPQSSSGGGGKVARPSSAGRSRPSLTDDQNQKQFHAFLARQNHTEMKKQKKMAQLKREQENKHTPELCDTTKAMTEGRQTVDFLKRMKQYQVREEHHKIRLKAQYEVDPECSFKPTLTNKSHELAEGGRSVVELSRGDHLRKETTQKLLRLRKEQEELATLTFAPVVKHTTALARNADSRIKINSEPETYLERLQKDMKKKKSKIKTRQQQIEAKELEECTFIPQTSDCPGYIKRIARSMALTKQAPTVNANDQPDWR